MVSDGEEPADLDRRRWYYITHGTILLDQWVDGPENMGGRNWLTTLDERAFKESLLRLQSVLRVWEWTAPRIWSLPERNDQVLAIAAGRMFDWPVEPWPEHGSTEPGLIVAYTLPNHTADMLNALVEHQPGQLLWCCAINWLDQFPVAADICSLLAISAFPFWEPFMPFAARPEDGYRKLDATEETPSELADRILATPVDPFSIEDLDALEAVALRVRDVTGLGAGPHRRPPGQDREDQPLDTMPPCEML
jgi:hypothetical protein